MSEFGSWHTRYPGRCLWSGTEHKWKGKQGNKGKKPLCGSSLCKPPTPSTVSWLLYADLTLGCHWNNQPWPSCPSHHELDQGTCLSAILQFFIRFLFTWINYLSWHTAQPTQAQELAGEHGQWQQFAPRLAKAVVLQQQPHSVPVLTCLNIFSHAHWHSLQKAQPVSEIFKCICHISYTQTSDLPRLISFML